MSDVKDLILYVNSCENKIQWKTEFVKEYESSLDFKKWAFPLKLVFGEMFARFSPTLQGRSRTFVDPYRVLDLRKNSRTASQSTSILDLKYRKIKKTAGGFWVLKIQIRIFQRETQRETS